MMRKGCFVAALIAPAGLLLAGRVGGVAAQETPHHGGELVFVVPAEPPPFDAHREESFALIHPAAPHYSTLMRVDPEPGLALFKFQSADVSHVNYSRYARLRGWTITPSHVLNNQLDTVWLAPE